jgi:hypothetical protein
MRIQILPLPSVMVGDDMQEPFALIVDQWADGAYDSSLQGFADACGAKAVWVRSETVEVADRYADSDAVAVREFNRLDDYMLMNFPDESGVEDDKDSAVDVAIRLLNAELLRRDAVKVRERFQRAVKMHGEQVQADA